MRIRSIDVSEIPPVKRFEVEDLSDLIVIAGPNGVGKTRLVNQVLHQFRHLNNPNISLEIQATNDKEKAEWGKGILRTNEKDDANKLKHTLQQNRSRRNFQSSIMYFESNRSGAKINNLNFKFEFPDPWEEKLSWDTPFKGLANRWEDTQHAIFKKIQSQKSSIAQRAVQLQQQGFTNMNLNFSDPLDPFKDAFYKLLGPKRLHGVDMSNQTILYEENDEVRNVTSLSSGEREVLQITFDFLLRNPSHCIVFFDEPELHLHPELLLRLIATLKSIGKCNQFIFVSHSPEVIASSLNDSVVFLTPEQEKGGNQAIKLDANSEATEALHRLGQSVGVISLGKKLVLIEGERSSLDKQLYSHILQNNFSDLVLLPSGGKSNLNAFDASMKTILDKTLFGIDFFVLSDGDAGFNIPEGNGDARVRALSKYHLENYFLNAEVLAKCFSDMEPEDNWLRSPDEIEKTLREIAKGFLSYATSIVVAGKIRQEVGNVDMMPKGVNSTDCDDLVHAFIDKAENEKSRINENLKSDYIERCVRETYNYMYDMLHDYSDHWKVVFPGKPILKSFAKKAQVQEGRLKNLYIQRSEECSHNPFKEIIDIFRGFSEI